MNAPDLLFVGEALLGNKATDQLVKCNAVLTNHSASDNPHTIDGIVLLPSMIQLLTRLALPFLLSTSVGSRLCSWALGRFTLTRTASTLKVSRRQNITALIHHFPGRGSCAHEVISV